MKDAGRTSSLIALANVNVPIAEEMLKQKLSSSMCHPTDRTMLPRKALKI
jgi:hypothetical protein